MLSRTEMNSGFASLEASVVNYTPDRVGGYNAILGDNASVENYAEDTLIACDGEIFNYADNAVITCGDSDNSIINLGDNVEIQTGKGNDQIISIGLSTVIIAGAGNDDIYVMGQNSEVYGQDGDDTNDNQQFSLMFAENLKRTCHN